MIKKLLFMFILLLFGSVVYAEKFTIGDYISGEYVKMVSDDTSKYLTIQRINDSNGNFVYCIEPFILVDENTEEYITYVKDLTGYKDLTEEQKRKVSLIAYYGYGYGNRMTEKWYAVTQMLIWRTVDPESDFYFTDKPNGNKINKYIGYMNEILSDVNYHDIGPTFIKDYSVNYKDDLIITNYDSSFYVDSTYDYKYNPSSATLQVDNVMEEGNFTFEKDADRYIWDTVIFDSENSQDLIRPGRVMNKQYTINVYVNSGDITLDIRKDNSNVYTLDSDFSNTCYEISDGNEIIDRVCTGTEGLVYKTDKLPYGEYFVKQVSNGKGYEQDEKEYIVIVDGNDNALVLNNNLIKNNIELVKYYCINEDCLYEENAIFNIFDNQNNLVGSIATNSDGYGNLEVGYGEYTIIQDYGLDNYTFVDQYTELIVNSSDKHFKELYNYYIEEIPSDFENTLPEDNKDEVISDSEIVEDDDLVIESDKVEDKEEVQEKEENDNIFVESDEEAIIEPPYTGTKLAEFVKILYNVVVIVICYCKFKRICYNN